jgi:tRNA pseudouridine13 synthase
MKLKRTPNDFCVEEQISLQPAGGPFALYRLSKQSLGTLEAIAAIARRWDVRREWIAFAGLKDKHARTIQYVTIREGPRRGISQTNWELEYVGQCERPVHASDILGNRFEVVLRDMDDDELRQSLHMLSAAAAAGLPNYFDNQRFGSLGLAGEFIAQPWCLGNYERALWLALADANVHDWPAEREQKRILREQWGAWPQIKSQAAGWPTEPILAFLTHQPRDFRRALALVPHDLRSLWLAAFQSHLWNQILAAVVRQAYPAETCASLPIGGRDLPCFAEAAGAPDPQLAELVLPLPSARLHLDGSPLSALYDRVLAAEGLALRNIRVKYPRDSFFSKGNRPALLRPGQVEHWAAGDELYPGRQKLTLRFTLPRGAYATLLVKHIAGLAGDELGAGDERALTEA